MRNIPSYFAATLAAGLFLSLLPAPSACAQDESDVATLEGQVIDDQQQVDAAQQNLKAAEKDAEPATPPATASQIDQEDAELDGLVVEEKKEKIVLARKEKEYKRDKARYEQTGSDADKKKAEESRREYAGAFLDYGNTESKITAKEEQIYDTELPSSSPAARGLLEKREKELARAESRLDAAEGKLRIASSRGGGGATSRGVAINEPASAETVPSTWFRSGEVQLRAFGVFAGGDVPGKEISVREGEGDDATELKETVGDRAISDNALGAGGGVNYFLTRYFGIGAEGDWLNGDHDVWLGMGSVIARYPIEAPIHVAPYAMLGGGGQFDYNKRLVAAMGGGVEVRFTPDFGFTTDARWLFNGKENLCLVTFGFSIALGGGGSQ